MLNTIGHQNVSAISGVWLPQGDMTANYVSYANALGSGMSSEEAALSTFTGKMAARNGFSQVMQVQTDQHGIIRVIFQRPGGQ